MSKDIDFIALSKQERKASKRMRLLALAHFKEGMSRAQIAVALKVSRTSVNKWVAAFLKDGLAGLDAKPPTGRPPSLTPEQLKQLSRYVEFQSQSDEGGRLTGEAVRDWIAVDNCDPIQRRIQTLQCLPYPSRVRVFMAFQSLRTSETIGRSSGRV